MAHSCRWRFPARPGGSINSGTGKRAGRIRVTASLRAGTGTYPNTAGLGPGFDAAVQVSAAIGNNLQTFRDVLGESSGSSSGEDEAFGGFGAVSEHSRVQSPARSAEGPPWQEKKPRGRPPRALTAHKAASGLLPPSSSSSSSSPALGRPDGAEQPGQKMKRLPGRPPGSGEKRRGRPPAVGTQRPWHPGEEGRGAPLEQEDDDNKDRKWSKRTPLGSVQQQDPEAKGGDSKLTKLKRLREVKLSPLKSRLQAISRKGVAVPGVPRRRRGRPPSAERLKAQAAAAAAQTSSLHKAARGRDSHPPLSPEPPSPATSPPASPSPSRLGRPLGLRQSPRHVKPVRMVPPAKRTDATIAKQLLQRAKKGVQMKKLLLENEAGAMGAPGVAGGEGAIRRRRRTQLKNIRQFIMPVVSTVSLRIIKTPKRFIEDEGSFGAPPPHMKMPRLETPPSVTAPLPPPPSSASPVQASSASNAGTPTPSDSLPPPPAPAATPTAPPPAAGLLASGATNGRFSSSAASCGSMSQHSSQLSSAESSRSSSPSLDDSSCDSQASEATQAPSEAEHLHSHGRSSSPQAELHTSRPPSPPSEPEVLVERGRRGRRGQGSGRGSVGGRGRGILTSGGQKAIISPATGVLMSSSALAASQQASSTASSSSSPPPPPLLTPPQPPQSAASSAGGPVSEHHPQSPWILPHPIAPFLQSPASLDKRGGSRSILREPTFRWTSLSRSQHHYFSSAKYAKEGLIRKPVFDNFRPPPLTAEDVGLMPGGGGSGAGVTPGGFPAQGGGSGSGSRLFSPLHHHHHQPPSSRFEAPPLQKRSPLLRAPRFTPSEAHSRIFESVTLHSSSGSSPGSLSPLQTSSSSLRSIRRKKRRALGTLRSQPRSPSHSMTRRSSQSGGQVSGRGASDLSAMGGSASGSLPVAGGGVGVPPNPLVTSALTPASFSSFSSPVAGALGLSTHTSSDSRRPAASMASSSSQLFPLFASSSQEPGRGAGGRPEGGRGGTTAPKEKDRDTEKSREREKENKREGRKDKRGGKVSTPDSSPSPASSLFSTETDDNISSLAPKKTPGRKKQPPVDSSSTEAPPTDKGALQTPPPCLSKGRLTKKGRPSERGADPELEDQEREKPSAPTQPAGVVPGQALGRQAPAPSLGSMLAHAEKQPVADKSVARVLRKAKDQLFSIEKIKSLKPPDQPKAQGQESDSSEASVRGPRIKHVCRRAAVALGRNRAVFPDDMPTLSALPWEEREKILSSMGNDDKSSVAGSEEAEPQSPPIKPVTRNKSLQEAPPRKGRRSRRCGQCPGCQVPEDCGVCTNCLDKPKFGGRNIKKQCCKVRKCQNLQWMPSKMFLQKQGKGKKDKKKKLSDKKEGLVKGPITESALKTATPILKEEPPRRKSETPPPKAGEEKQSSPASSPAEPPQPPSSTPTPAQTPGPTLEAKQAPPPTNQSTKKGPKSQQPTPPSSSSSSSSSSSTSSSSSSSSPSQSSPSPPAQSQLPSQQQQRPSPNQGPPKKDALPKVPPPEPKRKAQQQPGLATPTPDTVCEAKLQQQQQQQQWSGRSLPSPPLKPRQKDREREKAPAPRALSSSRALNWQSTPSGGRPWPRAPWDGVHRIRLDFQRRATDPDRVWQAGGLSLLTSTPITPRVICFLCASSGNVEFVFCQVCCEPFHLFCLAEAERPLEEQRENWCCRQCRFCQTCGRQHHKTKQSLLECDKCRNSYHPECLAPNHPTAPTKKKRVWVCTKCVRCKSCGATKPGRSWDAQWSHDFSLCHDCAKLFAKGNFCPLCKKCYDDDDFDSKMMQCGRCDHWVHSKCEGLTDEMYELMSKLPESVAYTCTHCTERPLAEWRTALEREQQAGIRQILTALLNSRTSTHLLRYRQAVMKPPELNPETEERLPSRRSPEGPDPPVLTEVGPPSDSPPDLESVEKKMDRGLYKSVLEFSDDIVKIIQAAMNSDGGQPENRKANSMVKSFFIRQMERVFPWFKVKESRYWESHQVSPNSGLLPHAVLPPSLDHNYAQWQEREEQSRAEHPPLMKKIIPAPRPKTPGEPDSPTFPAPPPHLPPPPPLLHDLGREDSPEVLPPPGVSDNRQCVLCLKYGDENTKEGGRLLYMGQNEWTHVNCALWSAEVFEDDDGSLKNVHMAVHRGRQLRCEACQNPGATVCCCVSSCSSSYHFMCARQKHCVFLEDKKVYCQRHRDLSKGEVVSESGFEVTRRVLVDLEGISLKKKFLAGLEPENVHMMIGSLTIDCLGILTELSDCERMLFPIGYQCSRVYWSTLDARKRCVYTCRILVCRPPVVESEMAAPEENRTIVHSPLSLSDKEASPWSDPFDSPKRCDALSPPTTPKLRVYSRNRHPSYPPCQRSPGSRPLPSPDGSSQAVHEIVTVGDPLLSSSLKSIGSRRHSTPSLSPPPPPHTSRHKGLASILPGHLRPLPSQTRALSSPPPSLSRTFSSPLPTHTRTLSSPSVSHMRTLSSPTSSHTRPLSSPPPLIPSPMRDPERARGSSRDQAHREADRTRLPSRDSGMRGAERSRGPGREQSIREAERAKSSREPGHRDSEKTRQSSRDSGLRDVDKARPARDQGLKELEKGRPLCRDPSQKDTDRGRPSNRDPGLKEEKGRQTSKNPGVKDTERGRQPSKDPGRLSSLAQRDTEKGRAPGGDPSSRDSERDKSSSKEPSLREAERGRGPREQSLKETERTRHSSREQGQREGEKAWPLNRDTERGRLSTKDPGSKDAERGRPHSKDPGLRDMDKTRQASRDPSLAERSRPGSGSRSQGREASSASPGAQHRPSHGQAERKVEAGGKEGLTRQAAGEVKTPRLGTGGLGVASVGQASPVQGTAILTSHQKGGSVRTEKSKQAAKDTEQSGGLMGLSRQRPPSTSTPLLKDGTPAPLTKDRSNPGKDGASVLKDAGKPVSPQRTYERVGGKKSQEHPSGPTPAATLKPLWSSSTMSEDDIIRRGSSQPAPMTVPAASHMTTSGAKDKPVRGRSGGSREVSKERGEKSPHNSNKTLLLNNSNKASVAPSSQTQPPLQISSNSKALSVTNSSKASGKVEVERHEKEASDRRSSRNRERLSSPERRPSPSLEPRHTSTPQPPNELSSRDKKRAVKVSQPQLKTDPNGTNTISSTSSDSSSITSLTITSPAGQGTTRLRASSRPPLFSSASSSESSESESQPHPEHPLPRPQRHILSRGPEDDREGPEADRDDDHALEDDGSLDKHQEDDSDGSGSAKRRYPRRSARARSNMFYGLTPFYGVRSYGEEDLPFYASGEGLGPSAGAVGGKKRSGGGRRSAEGQVDGADDMSTSSSSGDSAEEEEGSLNPKDPYYYNFTRTIVTPGGGLPSIEGIDQCLGRGSQLQRFLKDEEEEAVSRGASEEGLPHVSLSQQRIGQLDGVDDGSESDASVSTNTTPTTATAAAHRPSGKRRGRDRHANKQEQEAGKEADTTSRGAAGGGSSNSRDSRKSQKDNCLPLGAVKSQGGSQGQDPLEAQLSLSTDLLKSDSDNNNSDDCGNILPSDIMEFVLNTPSMQAMGQQAEPSSSDILFEDFPQPLAGAEPVEGGVAGVEEPYGLPLELPSDLSVLTTRSPTVNSSQNQPALLSDGPDRSMLALSSNPDGLPGGKGGDNKRGGAGVSPDSQSDAGSRESQVTEGHMTPEHFIPSPAIGQVVDGGSNQDVTRSSGTPGLPSSPSLPLQGQKYLPATANPSPGPCPNPGPSQAPSPTVHTASPHLKPGPEKLIVVNQHLQPLYVLQTLANGVTQKIQIAPSVSATGVIDTSSSVLSSMTLTTGLSSSGLTTSQSLFPAGGKVLGTMPHHSHIHTFTSTTQTGFQTGIPSTTSGLLIGVPSQAHDPHILVTEAGRPQDIRPNVAIVSSPSSIAPSPAILASGHGKKRPISRLQPRKTKKLARSRSQPTLAPSEVGHPNMTLINLSSPQITAGIPAQPGSLVELGTLTPANSSSHRKVPNIIKRPKTGGVMYFGGAQGGILGPDPSTHLLPCTVASLNPNQSVLNVVSMPSSAASGLLGPGSVSLSTPILSSSDITGPISNLLFKAGPHGLGLSDQPMVLQSGGGAMMSQLGSGVQTSIACVLPSHQTFSMAVTHQGETESSITHAHHLDPGPPAQGPIPLAPAPSPPSMDPAKGRVVGVFTHQTPPSQSSRTTAISRASESRLELRTPSRTPSTGGPTAGKSKQKAKRSRQSPEKTSGKKLKSWQADTSKDSLRDAITGSRDPISPEPMETGRPSDRGTNKSVYGPRRAEAPPSLSGRATDERGRTSGSAGLQTQGGAGGPGSHLVVSPPDQRGGGRDSLREAKPKKGLIFEICSDDGFHIRCESIEEAWKSLTDKVQEARSNARLKELSFEGVNGLRMLGVVHEAVVFLLEQLHGSRHCRNYRFRFHKPEEPHPLPLNPHGAARAELHHRRSVFDMFNFLASKHRQPPEYNPLEDTDEEGAIKAARRSSGVDLPLAQRFRQLNTSSRQSVGVYRSPIHGRGLFCKKTIEAGEMVIEYSGNVIRSVLTDKREKLYDSKGIGCYMFRIDDYEVVDATVHGNAARFINHSCEPNCHSRVLSVDGQKHIVIFSSRRVYRGEELTYDYKFPTEEPANKLPCNCGTKKCRKFLN